LPGPEGANNEKSLPGEESAACLQPVGATRRRWPS